MKRIIAVLFLLASIAISAQVTITMEQQGGVYRIPCTVNGAKMKFIFDTGAATVCLSESMAEYLLDNGYISINDIVGTGSSVVADGRIVDHVKIILNDIEIAGLHLKNVETVVIVGQTAPLLLGQSAIQKLGVVSISGNKLIINNAKQYTSKKPKVALTEEDEYVLYGLQEKLSDAIKQKDTALICVKREAYLLKYWKHYEPEEDERHQLAWDYFYAHNYQKTKYWLSQIVDKDEVYDLDQYYYLWAEYYWAVNNYSRAQFYYSKAQDETLDLDFYSICEKKIKLCKSKQNQ